MASRRILGEESDRPALMDTLMADEELARRIGALSPTKRALLDKLRRLDRRSAANSDDVTMSWGQERFWFIDKLTGGAPLYNIGRLFRIEGHLDVQALQWALDHVVERHQILRTTYPGARGRPQAHIERDRQFDLEETNLSTLPDEVRTTSAANLLRDAIRRPIDLAQGPVTKGVLLDLGRNAYLFLLMIHHIASDLWSVNVLMTEVLELYGNRVLGEVPRLSTVPQYCEFASWQRTSMSDIQLKEHLNYWRNKLAGALPHTTLTIKHARHSDQAFGGRRHYFFVSSPTVTKLKDFGSRTSCTPFMSALAALAATLRFYSPDQDVVIGTPVVNRRWPESEFMVGFFLNSLPIRIETSATSSFAQLANQVRQTTLEALAHQDLPFEMLVASLQHERRVDVAPIFQIAMNYVSEPLGTTTAADVSVTPLVFDDRFARLDLTVSIVDADGTWIGSFEYDAALFDADAIDEFAGLFMSLLETALDNPDVPLSGLRLGRQQLPRVKQPITNDPHGARSRFHTAGARSSELSNAQTLIWMDQLLNPDTPLYNSIWAVTLNTPIDLTRMQTAFQALVDRNDALRTVVESEGARPYLCVLPAVSAEMEFVDLSGFFPPQDAYKDWLTERSRRRFDLTRPLFDSALVKLGRDQFVWYLNLHHIISDAWATSLLVDQMSQLYRGDTGDGEKPGLPTGLPKPPQPLQTRGNAEAETFWRNRLSTITPALTFDNHLSRENILRTSRVSVDLGRERTARLREVASKLDPVALSEDLAIAELLVSITCVFLHELSGIRDVSLGISFSNRATKSERQTVGSLMTVCPINVKLQGRRSASELIPDVRAELLTVMRFSQHAIGNPQTSPAYDVSLTYHNARFGDFDGAPTAIEWIHPGWGKDHLAIHVSDYRGQGSWRVDFDYRTSLFDPLRAEGAIHRFSELIDMTIGESDQRPAIRAVDGLEQARARPQVPADDIRRSDVVELISSAARAKPKAVAVVDHVGDLTYEDLEMRATQIAQLLQGRGVGPEARVGICLERCRDWVVGVLAILKAGGAYVPIGCNDPAERQQHILRDSRIETTITRQNFVPFLKPADRIDFESIETALEGRLPESVEHRVLPRSLAYVMYTSGSSGPPKAVGIEHRSLLSYCLGAIAAYGIQSDDRILSFASLTHDGTVEEVFASLVAGATVVMRSDDMLGASEQFLRDCAAKEISVLDLPTAYWHQLADGAGSFPRWPALRMVVIGGEKASTDKFAAWCRRTGGGLKLINTYGPTETTVAVTAVVADCDGSGHELPIGWPMAGAHIWLLNPDLEPAATDQIGEIYIGGPGVSRGYLSSPALTAERFVPVPFGQSGQRMFRTGDLARRLADGNILFHGRVDSQVKIRGFRVELREVEEAIEAIPQVGRAAVIARTDSTGANQLIGFVAPAGGQLDEQDLRKYLPVRLPEYMVPSHFVILNALPVLASGKVNRTELALKPLPSASAGGRPQQNLSETERVVAATWANLFERDDIDRDDDFFALGGHSLMVIQVLSRIFEELGTEVSVRAFFENSTIAKLANVVDAARSSREP